jgi:hypothetical protein
VRIEEIFGNPIALIILLPFLPFIILASILSAETRNVEEWSVREDPETGEIRIVVHRHVRRE